MSAKEKTLYGNDGEPYLAAYAGTIHHSLITVRKRIPHIHLNMVSFILKLSKLTKKAIASNIET